MILCPWKDITRYAPVIPGLQEAIDCIAALPHLEPATYPLPSGGKVMIQAGTTKPWQGAQLEAHRAYLDIQYILRGSEVVGWAPTDTLAPAADFDTAKDKGMYTGDSIPVTVTEGCCYIVFPEDGHAPGKHTDTPASYVKAVIKLKV